MRQFLTTVFCSLIFLVIGLAVGIGFAPQLKGVEPIKTIADMVNQAAGARSVNDENSPYELYDYPTIKWRPKAIAEVPGAIVQLWTRYEPTDAASPSGKVNYKLTVFKAPDKGACEVQLLDDMGFKLIQFNAGDFHNIPGAPNIMEARESFPCTEAEYKKVRDYSIK